MGTVLDPESARIAILAGAQFVVCPTLNVNTIRLCRRYSIPVMPGAFTPSEILEAWETGADILQVSGRRVRLSGIRRSLPAARGRCISGKRCLGAPRRWRRGDLAPGEIREYSQPQSVHPAMSPARSGILRCDVTD